MSETHLSDLEFASLGLTENVLKGVEEAGFARCTPIQAQTLPLALNGRDVAGQAQTGTGKTAAFLLGLFHHLETNPPDERRKPTQPRALIMAPTRELAIQIYNDAESLGKFVNMRLALAYGGTDYDKQRRRLQEGVEVLIGTPGRLIDYFKQGVFDLKAIQVMVLDEADRMFDLGFIKDIRYVLRRLPEADQRLNMLFSATLGHRVLELAYEHMNDPELIQIETEKITADRVRQVIYYPSNREKMPLLIGLLKAKDPRRTMVFVNTKRSAEKVERFLRANDINAEAISGDVPQRKRQRMLTDFQSGDLAVLVGTDVASRGLHIPGVSHVFNFDLPQDAEDYVHRIGRTARAGEEGDAISFGCEDYAVNLPDIEAYIDNQIPVERIEPGMLPRIVIPERPPRRPRRDQPPSRSRGGGHGSRSGGGRSGGGARRPKPPSRSNSESAADGPAGEAAPTATKAASGEGTDAPKKRRRRRRKKAATAATDGPGSTQVPSSERSE